VIDLGIRQSQHFEGKKKLTDICRVGYRDAGPKGSPIAEKSGIYGRHLGNPNEGGFGCFTDTGQAFRYRTHMG
jgi:hypothetical protein